ncbi:ABC transporter ATP-binding protein [Arthrobacter sp. 260]|uniref:ABC transporter ATP-binding protein n=1 Tax=Arthrobacter sp. 260 TaxID=2735314 RepID=UPI0014930F4A|nr:ABC transporter ATP-binding protein [Arthrobacter sp. 260]NOJ59227.1 ABC transporter ATP-binding protein [Arthrobacter sp. 260]
MSPQPARSRSAIEVSALTVRRSKQNVLEDVHFSVPRARITGLLGPSGSGKTTLLRTIVGVQRITYGTVSVLDRPAGDPALRREVGYMTQAPSVYADLTVEANVRYFGAMHGRRRADTVDALSAVGLTELAHRKAADLSGGQFSRVSLACALVAAPRLLVLDEPTVGLDPVLRVDLWQRFKDLTTHGTTLLVSSHSMEEAGRCDFLALLREGRMLAHLTPAELRQQTGTDDLEAAFLSLIRDSEAAPAEGKRP